MTGDDVVLPWTSAHVGIRGNEAKSGLNKNNIDISIPYVLSEVASAFKKASLVIDKLKG